MKLRIFVCGLLCTALVADIYACGESLYRVGKGISYREYTVPLPGNLLVLGPAESVDNLAAELGRAGHNVTVAESMSELAVLAQEGSFQVVIGAYSEYESFESASLLPNATYLPIAFAGVDEQAAREQFEYVMVPSKSEIKHYLKTIHRVLKKA